MKGYSYCRHHKCKKSRCGSLSQGGKLWCEGHICTYSSCNSENLGRLSASIKALLVHCSNRRVLIIMLYSNCNILTRLIMGLQDAQMQAEQLLKRQEPSEHPLRLSHVLANRMYSSKARSSSRLRCSSMPDARLFLGMPGLPGSSSVCLPCLPS